MNSKPLPQHRWLQRLVGNWSYTAEATMAPGQPAVRFTGNERVRSIGGLWIAAEGRGKMPGGGTATMILTLGYDPAKKRFVGTWIGSMMTNLWVYDGALSRAGRALTLNTTGPSHAAKGRTCRYRETIDFKSKNHRVFTSAMQTKGGKWTTFMTAHYRRTT